MIFDAAHNPQGALALARAITPGQDVVCCLAILEGKDAGGIVTALAPAVSHFVCTEIPPERIEGSGGPAGARGRRWRSLPSARRPGWSRGGFRSARGLGAGTRTCPGAGTGSRWRPAPTTFCRHMDREARSELLTMMGLVAVVVAVVILVFFAFGYVFGLLFL